MGNFFAELKRRHIYRVAAAYAVVAWVVLQIVNNVAPGLNLPNSAVTLVIVLLSVGFPIALVFAWIIELKAPAEDKAAVHARITRLDFALLGALAVVIGIFAYQQLAPSFGGTAKEARMSSAGAPEAGSISIAVLPFANVSADAGQEYFSDGMTDEIASALAKVANLRIVARSSAFQFKGQNQEARAMGQALGATHLIEGSVRHSGNRVRITAQLIEADKGLQLWSDNYDREITDIFAIQEDIAQAIAGALRVPLGLVQGESLVPNRTADLESYQQYLMARSLMRARSIDKAIGILEPLVKRDPNYAPASALLAYADYLLPFYSAALRNSPVEEARRVVKSALDNGASAARRAIQLDTKNAFGYGGLAAILFMQEKWAEAEDMLEQALALDRNDPDILQVGNTAFSVAGRLKNSKDVKDRQRGLEPFVPIYNITYAIALQQAGRSAESIPILEAIPADAAGGFYRNVWLAYAYAGAARFGESADTLLLITGDSIRQQSVQDAAQLLRQAPTKVRTPSTLPRIDNEMTFVYAHVGAPERMLEFFERSADIGYMLPLYQVWYPDFASLRKTERFKALLLKIGLVDFWKARGWPDLCHPVGADDFVCD